MRDKIRNEHMRSTLKVDRFGHKVRQSRLSWYGHVKCRDDDYVGRRVLETHLPGKRKRGRPKRRDLGAVKEGTCGR